MSARRYRFGPLEQRAVVGPLRPGQVVIVAVGARCSGWARCTRCGAVVGLVVGAAGAVRRGAAICVPFEGRTVEEWAPVGGALGAAPPPRRSAAIARPRQPAGLRIGGGGEAEHEASLPPELADLALLAVPYGSEQVGVIRRPPRRHLHGGAGGAGRRLRDCATPPSRSARSTPGARCWRAAPATAARSAGCSGSSSTLPGQGDELAAYFQAERDRTVPLDSGLVSSYIELIESAAPADSRARDPDRGADRPAPRRPRAAPPGRRRGGGLRAAAARGREPCRAPVDGRGHRLRAAAPAPVTPRRSATPSIPSVARARARAALGQTPTARASTRR